MWRWFQQQESGLRNASIALREEAVSHALWLTQQGRLKATISCSALTVRKTQSTRHRHSNNFQRQ
jgi:hypothetical protein